MNFAKSQTTIHEKWDHCTITQTEQGYSNGMIHELSAVYQYRMMLASNANEENDDGNAMNIHIGAQLQSGFHPKDRASYFSQHHEQIESAIKVAVRDFDDLVINAIMGFLDDRCFVCKCHLGVDFIPNHPLSFLSCHACKARSKSIISKGKALGMICSTSLLSDDVLSALCFSYVV